MANPSDDLTRLELLRESGDYEEVRQTMPADWAARDILDDRTILTRVLAAELCARDGNLVGIDQAIGPCLEQLAKMPFGIAPRVMLAGSLHQCLRGQTGEALSLVLMARNAASAIDDERLIAEAVHCEAEIFLSAGLLEKAIEKFEEAGCHYVAQQRNYRFGLSCLGLGRALIGLGRVEKARLALMGAIKTLANWRDDLSLAKARATLAEALVAMGKHKAALDLLEQAHDAFTRLGSSERAFLIDACIADVLVSAKAIEQASERVRQAMASGPAAGSKQSSRLLEVQARVYGFADDWKSAERSAKKAVKATGRSGSRTEKARARRMLGRIYLSQGREADAIAELRKALAEIGTGRRVLLELEIKALLSRAIYTTDPLESYRLVKEVENAIGGRALPDIQETLNQALNRIASGSPDSFFILSEKSLPTLFGARDQLVRWMVGRALSQCDGSPEKAGDMLSVTGTHVRKLIKRMREGAALYSEPHKGERRRHVK